MIAKTLRMSLLAVGIWLASESMAAAGNRLYHCKRSKQLRILAIEHRDWRHMVLEFEAGAAYLRGSCEDEDLAPCFLILEQLVLLARDEGWSCQPG